MNGLFKASYAGRKVLITGHSGFKGSWLSLWLQELGAQVAGFSLPMDYNPTHLELLDLGLDSVVGDVRDLAALVAAIDEFRPEIVFHLAAQPLVRDSYRKPLDTFATNVMGTLNVLEACRQVDSVRAVLCITTDKVYQNREWCWSYREHDPLGGHDPYSSSKACAEIAIASFRSSFFPLEGYPGKHQMLIATARAGNVVGGGDWAKDRLVPDIAKACSRGETVTLRNPASIRPWQHVLECLSGYLCLGSRLLAGDVAVARGYNFGPLDGDAVPVEKLVQRMKEFWPRLEYRIQTNEDDLHEAFYLKLDPSLAMSELGWKPIWNIDRALEMTAKWYRAYYEEKQLSSRDDLRAYVGDAKKSGLPWAR